MSRSSKYSSQELLSEIISFSRNFFQIFSSCSTDLLLRSYFRHCQTPYQAQTNHDKTALIFQYLSQPSIYFLISFCFFSLHIRSCCIDNWIIHNSIFFVYLYFQNKKDASIWKRLFVLYSATAL